jgi:hypothetical protein
MLDILNRLIHWLAEPADLGASRADPLSHPALEAMDERALADLPFPRGLSRNGLRGLNRPG